LPTWQQQVASLAEQKIFVNMATTSCLPCRMQSISLHGNNKLPPLLTLHGNKLPLLQNGKYFSTGQQQVGSLAEQKIFLNIVSLFVSLAEL
jgi:hypothetical protein